MVSSIVVSIICITYNHVAYITRALEGFLMQKTDFPFEIIVHDDASTDGTANIIREYTQKYPNLIRPILQEQNLHSAGIKASTYINPMIRGRYIAYCEGDDYWTDCEKLQIQVDFLEEHKDYIACCHQVQSHDMNTGEDKPFCYMQDNMDLSVEGMIAWDKGHEFIHLNSILYRASVLNQLPPYMRKTWIVGDMPLCVFLATQGKIRYMNRVMTVYNKGIPGSWSSRQKQQSDIEKYHAMRSWIVLYKAIDFDTNFQYHEAVHNHIVALKKSFYGAWIQRHVPLLYSIYKAIKCSLGHPGLGLFLMYVYVYHESNCT